MKTTLLVRAAVSFAFLGGLALAQTLPKGFDTTEGTEITTGKPSFYWGGFDIDKNGTKYNPARVIYLFDKSVFPWSGSTFITKLSVRREGPGLTGTTTAHTKKVRMFISTSNGSAAAPDVGDFENNHGSNKREVMGSAGKPKTVVFPATPAPAAGKTAPFNVVYKLDRPFFVQGGTKTLVVEIRTYSASVAAGRFLADAVTYDGKGAQGGWGSPYYKTHCISPKSFFWYRPIQDNSTFHFAWKTSHKQGMPSIGGLGFALGQGIKIPGTGNTALRIPQCEWWVNPFIWATTVTKGPNAWAHFKWFRMPNDTSFAGTFLQHQAIFLDKSYNQLGLGFTRAVNIRIGKSYDPKLVPATQVHSYGTSNHAFLGKLTDPDKEDTPRWFFRRTVIFKVN